ncbi:MAG TPA: choice-of-anchor D domain-containing protein [Bryobacteraceae bacterium]|nr:choice-of-anchor D domain-containing protein [Bryobacteraceae bacterium]
MPSCFGVDFGATKAVSRVRIYKDNDGGGSALRDFSKNLVVEYTTTSPSTPLSSRTCSRVTNHYKVHEFEAYGPAAGGGVPLPSITATPAQLAFGDVLAGQPKDLEIVIGNTGGGVLTVSSMVSSSAAFTLINAGRFPVEAGGQRRVVLRFRPAVRGPVTASLTIHSDDTARPAHIIALSGAGINAAGRLEASPSVLDFGSVNSGQTRDLTFQLRNTGLSTITIGSMTNSNARFSAVRPAATPFNVGGGSFEFVTVRFSPNAAGMQTGSLTLSSGDPQTPPLLVLLVGTGAGSAAGPVIEVTPANLDFGTVVSGQTRDLMLTVRNNGSPTLAVNSITSSNPLFTQAVLSTPLNVGAGSLRMVAIRFSAGAAGAQSATLTIAGNDPARPTVTVRLLAISAGTGTSTMAAANGWPHGRASGNLRPLAIDATPRIRPIPGWASARQPASTAFGYSRTAMRADPD